MQTKSKNINSVYANTEPLLYSIDRCAYTLGLSRRAIEYLVRQGTIATITIGRRKMIPKADVQRIAAFGLAFVRDQQEKAAEQPAAEGNTSSE